VHFRYRIAKNHAFALISVSLSGSSHRLLGVDRLLCPFNGYKEFYAQSYIRRSGSRGGTRRRARSGPGNVILSSLGSRLTGIVTTTDNGGSTGRIRRSEGGIAWGDMRNCINQLIAEPSVASAMFEYRFSGNGELSGHNLGNLMLKALDHLSVRPLKRSI
jgi:hypothetical protein